MIVLEGVSLSLSTMGLRTTVLEPTSLTLPSNQRLVVLAHPGSGKTSLIRLLAGALLPDEGRILRHARVSFPACFTGGYRRNMSVRENIAHAAYLYGADGDEVVDFVAYLADLGSVLHLDFSDLPPQLRLRMAFAVTYAIPFDTYLIDQRIVGGDEEFRLRCEQVLEARLESAGFILACSHPRYARRVGRTAAILHRGKLSLYEDMDRAIFDFEKLEKNASPALARGRESEDMDEADA